MNIAIVLEATLGGTRKHVLDLLHYFERDTQNKYYFIFSSKRADKLFNESLQAINKSKVQMLDISMSKNILQPVNFFRSFFQLQRYMKEKQIEIIHLHGASAGFFGRLASMGNSKVRKVIYSPHGGVLHKIENKRYGFLFLFLERFLISKKCHFIAVSENEKKNLIKYFDKQTKNIHLIHNGIDIERYDGLLKDNTEEISKQRIALGLTSSDIVLLYPALFLESKGQLNFIKQFGNHPIRLNEHIKIVFAGDGPLLGEAKKLVEKNKLNQTFIFPGFVKEMALFYQLCDAVILFSTNEAFGYVLLEAMLYSKTIFASRVGGIKDIVIEGINGRLYDVNELTMFLSEMDDLEKHRRNELQKMSIQSRQLLDEKFNLTSKVKELIALYKA